MAARRGLVVLFGSGETSASGRAIHDWVLRHGPQPIRLAILETPAGFQPNTALVAERIAQFFQERLQNHRPEVTVVAARRRGTAASPDDPATVAPLRHATVFFLGPGSPTYAVRQLADSLAWSYIVARNQLGATVALSSAGAIAASALALPVYEIYKAGEDLHWKSGLDLFRPFGLRLVVVPHWDNTEGGADLDTSRCFMGEQRFEALLGLLPKDVTILGIDEHTAIVFDVEAERCLVMGRGGVTVLREGDRLTFTANQEFPTTVLGPFRVPPPGTGVPAPIWNEIVAVEDVDSPVPTPSSEVLALVQARSSARARRDWAAADELRDRIRALHWQVIDRPDGPALVPLDEAP